MIIKVGDMVITKPELDLRDGSIVEPTEVIGIKGAYFEVQGKGYYSENILQKVNTKCKFSLSRDEVLPDLYLKNEASTLCVSTNYDDWKTLKNKPNKLFISICSEEEQEEFCMSFSLTQLDELIEYLNNFKSVMGELRNHSFKKKMTLQQIQDELGFEIELVDGEEF